MKKREQPVYKCDTCDEAFANKKLLRQHTLHNHRPPKFACDRCPDKFHSKVEFKKHSRRHQQLRHKCGQCAEAFESKGCLWRHISHFHLSPVIKEHRPAVLSSAEASSFNALSGELFTANWRGSVEQSRSTVTKSDQDRKPYRKPRIYIRKPGETDHNYACPKSPANDFRKTKPRTFLENDEVIYACNQCPKVYRIRSSYLKHMETHKKRVIEHFIKCDMCEATFMYSSDLRDHKLKHSSVTTSSSDMVNGEHASNIEQETQPLSMTVEGQPSKVNEKDTTLDFCQESQVANLIEEDHPSNLTGNSQQSAKTENVQLPDMTKQSQISNITKEGQLSSENRENKLLNVTLEGLLSNMTKKNHLSHLTEESQSVNVTTLSPFSDVTEEDKLTNENKEDERLNVTFDSLLSSMTKENQNTNTNEDSQLRNVTSANPIIDVTEKSRFLTENKEDELLNVTLESLLLKMTRENQYSNTTEVNQLSKVTAENIAKESQLLNITGEITGDVHRFMSEKEIQTLVILEEDQLSNTGEESQPSSDELAEECQVIYVAENNSSSKMGEKDYLSKWVDIGEVIELSSMSEDVQPSSLIVKEPLTSINQRPQVSTMTQEKEILSIASEDSHTETVEDDQYLNMANENQCSVMIKGDTEKFSDNRVLKKRDRLTFWKCGQCDLKFTKKVEFRNHKYQHQGVRPPKVNKKGKLMKCEKCGKLVQGKYDYRRHLNTHIPERERPYACDKCPKKFLASADLKTHERIHLDVKPYTCTECAKGFSWNYELTRHMRHHHWDVPFAERCYKCEKCRLVYERMSDLKRHLKFHERYSEAMARPSENINAFACHECEMCFTKEHNLKDHLKKHDVQTMQRESQPKQSQAPSKFTCNVCSASFTAEKRKLINHFIRYHCATMKYVPCAYWINCSRCPTTFKTDDDLQEHIEKKHPNDEVDKMEQVCSCIRCEGSFKSKKDLYLHSLTAHIDLAERTYGCIFTCRDCSCLFQTDDQLRKHILSKHQDLLKDTLVSFVCSSPLCSIIFKDEEDFQQHFRAEHQVELTDLLNCPSCPETFKDNIDLQEHSWTNHHKKLSEILKCLYTCKDCSINFQTVEEFQKHKLEQHEQKANQLFMYLHTCKKCVRYFREENQLQEHFVKLHIQGPINVPMNFGFCQVSDTFGRIIPKFQCKICSADFLTKCSLREHMKQENHMNQWICYLCNVGFKEANKLERHKLSHHHNTKDFKCDLCSKAYKTKSDLRKHHVAVHEGQGVCDVCGKQFQTINELKKHKILHVSSEELTCDICGKTLCSLRVLRDHKALHTNEMKYSCEKCPAKFRASHQLQRHKKESHPDNSAVVTCQICNKQFENALGLFGHMRIHEDIALPVRKTHGKNEFIPKTLREKEKTAVQKSGKAEKTPLQKRRENKRSGTKRKKRSATEKVESENESSENDVETVPARNSFRKSYEFRSRKKKQYYTDTNSELSTDQSEPNSSKRRILCKTRKGSKQLDSNGESLVNSSETSGAKSRQNSVNELTEDEEVAYGTTDINSEREALAEGASFANNKVTQGLVSAMRNEPLAISVIANEPSQKEHMNYEEDLQQLSPLSFTVSDSEGEDGVASTVQWEDIAS